MDDDRLAEAARLNRSPLRDGVLPRLRIRPLLPVSIVAVLAGCSGNQSALDPGGREADAAATLFWVMVAGGGLIWLAVMAALVYASHLKKEPVSERRASGLILFGGVAFPVTVLALLLAYAVWLMPAMRPWFARQGQALQRIEVTAEQYWWRIRYLDENGTVIRETANDLYMPVDEKVVFLLKAKDVIHSFWIPSIGGKMDAIPGRVNTLQLEATKPGSYRGVCAEFCGTAHALMAFTVQALPSEDFKAWLGDDRQSTTKDTASNSPGLAAFLRQGCGACHAIDGTEAAGTIGPNLTALGVRPSLAAGTLPNTQDNLARFIKRPDAIKPGVRMPGFAMLPDDEINLIASYLKGLE